MSDENKIDKNTELETSSSNNTSSDQGMEYNKEDSATKNIDNNELEYPQKEEILLTEEKLQNQVSNTTNFTLVDDVNAEERMINKMDGPTTANETVDGIRKNTETGYTFWAEQIANNHKNREERKERMDNDAQGLSIGLNNETHNTEELDNSAIWSIPGIKPLEHNERKEKSNSPFRKFAKGLAIAVAFGVVAGGAFIGVNEIYYKINPNAISYSKGITSSMNDQLNLINPKDPDKLLSNTAVSDSIIEPKTTVTDVVDNTMPSIVTINSSFTQTYSWFGQQGSEDYDGSGSGIIVGENDTELLIVTNNHVVDGANKISVTFLDDKEATAAVKGTDSVADLAVLAIDLKDIPQATRDVIKVATLGDSDNVKVGEMAIAIGNALGYGQSTTVGYIGAKDREVEVEDKTMVLLQTDAAINPGNSGGALLNIKGEVIGINTVKYSSDEVEGMGFAIPISRAIPIVNELMTREIIKDEDKGYIGVYVADVTEEQSQMFSWPLGVYVSELVDGGAAKEAGILPGDIIVEVNGLEITDSTQLIDKVTSYRYGTEVSVKIMRRQDGKFVEQEVTVTLGKKAETTTTK